MHHGKITQKPENNKGNNGGVQVGFMSWSHRQNIYLPTCFTVATVNT